MANFTLRPGPFPVGTTVGVYDHKTLIQDSGPIGAQLASAVTAADQTTAFTGLAFDTRYWAAASVSGTWRKVAFTTERDPLVSGSVSSVAGKTGVVSLVKADVGLGSVDNTSDAAKPISTATQAALNTLDESVADIFASLVFLEDYLPAGWVSGTTNVTTQVQAWVNACAGKKGIGRQGTFIVTEITVPSNTDLDGGGESCVFKRTGATPGSGPIRVFTNSDQAAFGNNTGITIRNMTVDRTEATGVNPYDNCIHMRGVDGLLISGVRARGSASGIHVEGCSNARIVHNRCDSFTDKGISVSWAEGYGAPAVVDPQVLVANNTLRQTAATKLAGIGSSPFICTQKRTVFANNVVVSTVTLEGFGVEIGGTDGSDIAVIGNVFQGCGVHYGGGTGGICANNTLLDGSVPGSARIAITQTGAPVIRVTVRGNHVFNDLAASAAISVATTGTFCVVAGNHCRGLGSLIDVRGDDCDVMDNTVEGAHQQGYTVASAARNRVSNNTARDCGVNSAGANTTKIGFMFDNLINPTISGNLAVSSKVSPNEMRNGYYVNAGTNIIWRDNDSRGHTIGVVTATGTQTYAAGARLREAANSQMGLATLVAGTVTVNNTLVTGSSRIFLTCHAPSGTPGALRVDGRTAGTSFTITSTSGTDTSQVAWMLVEPT